MEIADIRITVIFEQYMAYLDRMKQMDMENTGDIYLLYDPYRGAEMEAIKAALLSRMEGGNKE